MQRDETALLDIARAASLILEFMHGVEKDAFLKDIKTQSAILHQLMIIGEAAKRLSKEFRVHHSAIPWELIAGMRDKLIHGYDIVDLIEVWKTATKDIPNLLSSLEPLLPKQDGN